MNTILHGFANTFFEYVRPCARIKSFLKVETFKKLFIGGVMIDFSNIVSDMQDYFTENRRRVIAVCAVLVFMAVSALVILTRSMPLSVKVKKKPQRTLVLDQTLVPLKGPEAPDGYITTRKTQEKWSQQEIDEWFTEPDSTELDKLAAANDRIIEEILGAAP